MKIVKVLLCISILMSIGTPIQTASAALTCTSEWTQRRSEQEHCHLLITRDGSQSPMDVCTEPLPPSDDYNTLEACAAYCLNQDPTLSKKLQRLTFEYEYIKYLGKINSKTGP